jgi:hypothetical protein
MRAVGNESSSDGEKYSYDWTFYKTFQTEWGLK